MTIFAKLGLNATILENLQRLGYKTPTDIQEKSIGAVLSGSDTYAIAPTGTGKTAAYLLPLLQELSQSDHSQDQVRPIRALFLVPTRELAVQLEQSIADYGQGLGLRTISIFGGVRTESQIKRFKRGTDILVSTPKRLVDLLKLKAFSLEHIRHFVMDEADRLVSMGIVKELKTILAALPNKKQMVFFSATDSNALTKFSQDHQSNKKFVKAEDNQPALNNIVHTMYRSDRLNKTADLLRLIGMLSCDRALIFVRTKNDVNLITAQLIEHGFQSKGIHNEIPQKKRQETLAGFKNKDFKYLVATDIASRGIDVDDLYYVINYDLPVNSTDYIHRVGRTARTSNATQVTATLLTKNQLTSKRIAATNTKNKSSKYISRDHNADKNSKSQTLLKDIRGHAISLVSAEQERLVERIIKVVGKDIQLEANPFNKRK